MKVSAVTLLLNTNVHKEIISNTRISSKSLNFKYPGTCNVEPIHNDFHYLKEETIPFVGGPQFSHLCKNS